MLKKGLLFAVALMLVFAGNALAGPNATAVIGLDVDASGNGTDEGVTSATAAGTDAISVELFTAPIAGPVVGLDVLFDLDQAVVAVSDFAPPSGFFKLAAGGNSLQAGAVPSGTLSDAGYWGTVTFTPAIDVTGVEFEIGVTQFVVAPVSGGVDTLRTTTKLSFNSKPKVTADATVAVIPRGGQATATVTPSGFPAGATITFDVQVTGAATVEQAVANGVLTLTASGSGAASAVVTASDGTTTTDAVTITFDEQVPVELASFVGEVVNDRVVLNWATASQTNNAGFRVLRSSDQGTFEVVSDLIDGAGTTDALMNYSFTDETLPAAEQVFYVLERRHDPSFEPHRSAVGRSFPGSAHRVCFGCVSESVQPEHHGFLRPARRSAGVDCHL